MNKPRWRWAIFCAALEAHRVVRWEWLAGLWAWCILPAWLASEEELDEMAAHDVGAAGTDAPW